MVHGLWKVETSGAVTQNRRCKLSTIINASFLSSPEPEGDALHR